MSWPAPTGEPVGPGRGPSPVPASGTSQPDGTPQQTGGAAPYPAPGHPPAASSGTQSWAAPSAGTPSWPAPAAGGQSWPAPSGTPTSAPAPAADPRVAPVPGTGPGGPPPGTAVAPPAHGEIQILGPPASDGARLAPLDERTGQPVRPWTVWVSAVLMFGGAATVVAGLLLAMWQMASPWQEVGPGVFTQEDKFNTATWLTAQFPSPPASGMRVLFAIVCCLIAVLVAGTATVAGYYAFAGYRWTRIGGLVAVGVSLLALLLTPIASISIGLIALGAAPLWLPATSRFFARWWLLRHPQVAYSEPIDQVFYGPLARYR
jgi:hypothetical protein